LEHSRVSCLSAFRAEEEVEGTGGTDAQFERGHTADGRRMNIEVPLMMSITKELPSASEAVPRQSGSSLPWLRVFLLRDIVMFLGAVCGYEDARASDSGVRWRRIFHQGKCRDSEDRLCHLASSTRAGLNGISLSVQLRSRPAIYFFASSPLVLGAAFLAPEIASPIDMIRQQRAGPATQRVPVAYEVWSAECHGLHVSTGMVGLAVR